MNGIKSDNSVNDFQDSKFFIKSRDLSIKSVWGFKIFGVIPICLTVSRVSNYPGLTVWDFVIPSHTIHLIGWVDKILNLQLNQIKWQCIQMKWRV